MTQLDMFAELEREQLLATPWSGAPLGYTTDYFTPDELEAAFDRCVAEHGIQGCLPFSHMWHSRDARSTPVKTHHLVLLTADTRHTGRSRCPSDHQHAPGDLPDEFMYQTNCAPCRWHHISSRENDAVEAWHDHALPGWRDLPVMPVTIKRDSGNGFKTKQATVWLDEHQPADWRFPGAPIRTERKPLGTRHVPGRSPFGGYDLGHREDAA